MRALFILTPAIFSLSLAAYAQPSVAAGGVLNGASFATGQPVAPGSLISIFGTSLASTTSAATSVPLSTSLGNVTVTFNNIAAPLNYVSGNQINAQMPWEVAGQSSALVVVSNNGATSSAQAVPLTSAAPGLFFAAIGQTLQAIAYGNSDGAFAAPASLIPGAHPAKINDPTTLVLLATGLGPVNPPLVTGHGVDDGKAHPTAMIPTVLIGNVPAQVVFSGASPQFVGVYQINVIIATGTPTGNAVPIQIQMNGITTSNQITIAVSN